MNGNSFVSLLLRSPLHGFVSGNTMLVSVTGRKTGRVVTIPVNYVQEGGILWVLSYRERTWWRNLLTGAPVTLRLRGKDRRAFAQVVLTDDEIIKHLGDYIRRLPLSGRALHIRMEAGEPTADDLALAARGRLMIRIKLDGS